MSTPSISDLKRALSMQEQIERLEAELRSILSGTGGSVIIGPSVANGPRVKKKRTMSPAARERIAAAQRARWAKSKGETVVESRPAKTARKKRTMSPEARARIVAAQKKRWAAFKKEKR